MTINATAARFVTHRENHDFGTVDSKGRKVGFRAVFGTVEYTADCNGTWLVEEADLCLRYTLRTMATRNGEAYCDNQPAKSFDTLEAAQDAAAKALAKARAKAK